MTVLTFVDELERKTLAYVEVAAIRHEQGVLSDREFSLVMDAVWQITAGLVDQVGHILAEVADMKLDQTIKTLAIPMSAEPAVINIERSGRVLRLRSAKNVPGTPKEYDTEADAVAAVNQLKTTLEGRGFIIP
jgi:hypothetical protein